MALMKVASHHLQTFHLGTLFQKGMHVIDFVRDVFLHVQTHKPSNIPGHPCVTGTPAIVLELSGKRRAPPHDTGCWKVCPAHLPSQNIAGPHLQAALPWLRSSSKEWDNNVDVYEIFDQISAMGWTSTFWGSRQRYRCYQGFSENSIKWFYLKTYQNLVKGRENSDFVDFDVLLNGHLLKHLFITDPRDER